MFSQSNILSFEQREKQLEGIIFACARQTTFSRFSQPPKAQVSTFFMFLGRVIDLNPLLAKAFLPIASALAKLNLDNF